MYQPKVLITGAGGYIGRHVVNILLDSGINVIAADINTDNIDNRAKKLNINIFSGEKNIYESLGSPDICLHLAWKDGFSHNSISHMELFSTHFMFLYNMLNAGLKHLAVMGTMHEVGYFEGEINGDTPTNPLSLYGIAKNSLRQSLTSILKDKDVIFQWLRAYYIYGDDNFNHSVFTKLLEAERNGQEKFPLTTGNNKCDYISVDTLARQIAASLLQTKITGIINCCSGNPKPLKEVVEDFVYKNKLNISLDFGAYSDRPYDSSAIWGNTDNISKILHDCIYKSITDNYLIS